MASTFAIPGNSLSSSFQLILCLVVIVAILVPTSRSLPQKSILYQSFSDDADVREIVLEVESPPIALKQPTDRKEKRREKEEKAEKRVSN